MPTISRESGMENERVGLALTAFNGAESRQYTLRNSQTRRARPHLRSLSDDLPRASQRTGAETSLNFINRSRDEVELFWLSTEGERRSYGKLAAGESRDAPPLPDGSREDEGRTSQPSKRDFALTRKLVRVSAPRRGVRVLAIVSVRSSGNFRARLLPMASGVRRSRTPTWC